MRQKYVLFFAALAALASCVKENNLLPEQTAGDLVTIKAVSADTKTVLNGADVVWENTDEIKVILDYAEDELQDFAISSLNGSTASFTGNFDNEVTADHAYAVYPNSAVVIEGGVTKVKHTLPADQSAGVTSGMNLSFADLDVEALAAGNATATFENALALVKVIIPEGVKSVSLTSARDALVGDIVYLLNPSYGGIYRSTTPSPTGKTVSLAKAEGLPTDNSILVYPGNAGNLTLTMVGLDGTTYTKTTSNEIIFTASEYRTINLANIFNMAIEDVKAVSPMGETFTFDIVATKQYDYNVAIEGDPAWITLNENAHVTKAFVGTKVSFTVEANTSGSPREANVTITWDDGEEQSRSFKVTQASAYLDFVYVDPTADEKELIQWEETFDIFSDESLSSKVTASPYKGVFTIEINEENPEKGTYIVRNIFKNTQFVFNGNHTDKGGEYYANYADGKLTILKSDAILSSYTFANDVVLNYDSSLKKFTSGAIELGFTPGGLTNQNDKFIGNYTATVKADDPDDSFDVTTLYGVYTESYTKPQDYYPNPETTVISTSSNPNYDLEIKFFFTEGDETSGYGNVCDLVYGNVNSDGTEITVDYTNSNFFASPGTIILTVNGDVLSGTFAGITDYTATRQTTVNIVDEIVSANWIQDFGDGTNSSVTKNQKVTFTKIDDTHVKILYLFDKVTIDSAVVDPVSKTITVPEGWSHPYADPSVTNPGFELVISDDYCTINLDETITIGGYMDVVGYKLTKEE